MAGALGHWDAGALRLFWAGGSAGGRSLHVPAPQCPRCRLRLGDTLLASSTHPGPAPLPPRPPPPGLPEGKEVPADDARRIAELVTFVFPEAGAESVRQAVAARPQRSYA